MLGIRALLFKIGTSGLAGQRVALLPSFMLPAPLAPEQAALPFSPVGIGLGA